MAKIGSKSANNFQVKILIFRTNLKTGQGALPQLSQARDKKGWVDSRIRFETGRTD